MSTPVLTAFLMVLLMCGLTIAENVDFSAGQNSTNNYSWSTYLGNEGHTGFSLSNAPNSNQTFWIYNGTIGYPSVPVADDGNLYIGSVNSRVDTIDALKGDFEWSFQTQPYQYLEHAPYVATGYGMVFVCPWTESKVYALNATNGNILWSFEAGYRVGEEAPVVSNGILYVCSTANLMALDAKNGTALWTYSQPNGDASSSFAVSNGRLFIGHTSIDSAGAFVALNATTGNMLWNITLGIVSASPSAVDGKVFVHVEDSKLYSLNETNGNILWS